MLGKNLPMGLPRQEGNMGLSIKAISALLITGIPFSCSGEETSRSAATVIFIDRAGRETELPIEAARAFLGLINAQPSRRVLPGATSSPPVGYFKVVSTAVEKVREYEFHDPFVLLRPEGGVEGGIWESSTFERWGAAYRSNGYIGTARIFDISQSGP